MLKLKLIDNTWLDKIFLKNPTWLAHVDACDMKKFKVICVEVHQKKNIFETQC